MKKTQVPLLFFCSCLQIRLSLWRKPVLGVLCDNLDVYVYIRGKTPRTLCSLAHFLREFSLLAQMWDVLGGRKATFQIKQR